MLLIFVGTASHTILFSLLFPGLNYFIKQCMEGGSDENPVGYGLKLGGEGGPTLRSPWIGISQIYQQLRSSINRVRRCSDISK